MEIWTSGVPAPRGIVRVARDLEECGWDGINVVDSQNLAADPFVALAMAAAATERLKLGTGVANTTTRTAAVLASTAATVHSVSRGRMVLGVGRGDSALAHLGRAPARLGRFERYLRHLQVYLAGGEVPFGELTDIPYDVAPPVEALELAHAPSSSRIGWMAAASERDGKVTVEVAATGPKVIAIAARQADRVMFALGAHPDRVAWGIGLARDARREAGLDPDGVEYGAYVSAACHPDIGVARDMVRGGLTVAARFSVMHGSVDGPLSKGGRAIMRSMREAYDMRKHTHGDSPQADILTPEFIDEYAAVGSPDRVLDRLMRLRDLGLSKVVVNGGWRNTKDQEGPKSKHLIETEVLPYLTGRVAGGPAHSVQEPAP